MRPLPRHTGKVAVLDRADVDTDQIIPKQFLKRIERSGYGEFLFFDWMKDTDFELHRYPGASILIAGRNFGCGSSREHAAWALDDYGFRVVIAPSFSDIFRTNAINNGMAPIALDAVQTAQLARHDELTVDVERLEITAPDGTRFPFELEPHAQETLVLGLDDVARTLQRENEIARFEQSYEPRFDLARL
jgi:3-isopropylmalate/(R)-2-methylmalate dehydratase small subunit